MPDLTRVRKTNEKKSYSVAAGVIEFSQIAGTEVYNLFELPPQAVITRAIVVPEIAGQANLTADVGFVGGTGDELFNDVGFEQHNN